MKTNNKNMLKYAESDLNITYIDAVFNQHLTNSWRHAPKVNPFHRLFFVLEGEFIAYIDGSPITVKKNQILYVPNEVSYQSESLSSEFYYIGAMFSLGNDGSNDYPFKSLYDLQFPEKFAKLFENLEKVWLSKTFGYRLRTKMALYDIFRNLLAEHLMINDILHGYNTIKSAVHYIEENYYKDFIDLNDLAKMSGITPTHFIRLFKSIYSTTPIKYINKLRMDRAIELLDHSSIPINEIAQQLGFHDVSYFSKLFKRTYGKSPLQHRMHS